MDPKTWCALGVPIRECGNGMDNENNYCDRWVYIDPSLSWVYFDLTSQKV